MYKNKWISFVGIGIEAVAIILTAVWFGQWLDLHLQFNGLFSIILPLSGLVGWVYHVIIMVKKISQN